LAIAAGFSGHGFKFASGVGEALSQLVTKGKTEHDLSLFSINRPALLSKRVQLKNTIRQFQYKKGIILLELIPGMIPFSLPPSPPYFPFNLDSFK
jgi:hypothetical protein